MSLKNVHIKNYLSFQDVTLPFKPLTVIVGPNASGKSNVLSALYLLKTMTVDEGLPAEEFIQKSLWAGEGQKYSFDLHAKVEENQTLYHLEMKPSPNFPFHAEQLSVNGINVISIQDGHGVVHDENGENELKYNSNELALRSAGNYGNKPVTRTLAEFIKKWQIYDFMPDFIRSSLALFSPAKTESRELPKLDTYGIDLPKVLWNWHKNSPESFRNVSDALAYSTHRKIDQRPIDGKNQLCLLEGYKNPIPLDKCF